MNKVSQLISLLSVSILLFPFMGVKLARAGDPNFCDQYAKTAINQFELARREPLGQNIKGPAWSADYNSHYKWCLVVSESAATSSSRYRYSTIHLLRAQGNYTELLIPGMVIGLRHRNVGNTVYGGDAPRGNNQDLYNPIVDSNSILDRLIGGDLGAPSGVGFTWNAVKDQKCPVGFDLGVLPPGIVLGLWHSQNQRPGASTVNCTTAINDGRFPSGRGIAVMQGGDLGAPRGHGYTWFVTTGERFSGDWSVVDKLPKYTVIGLTHTSNIPNYRLRWKDGIYNPSCSSACPPPPGFTHVMGGDLGAPAGQGFAWYEKVTGVEPRDLGGRYRYR